MTFDRPILFLLTALLVTLGVSACYSPAFQARPEIADRLAHPVRMQMRLIEADPFTLTAYERIKDKGGDATVYIEGDGQTWINWTKPAEYPSPINPVSLHLATRDLGYNVIYLARPCQYNQLPADVCDNPQHWTSARYNKLTIEAMHKALNNIKKRYGIKKFNLVGWGGGGTVAAILAARRDDVASLRTVAAILDHEMLTDKLNTREYAHSLNARDFAAQVRDIPQHHFVGKQDEVASSALYHEFRDTMGYSRCIRYSVIDEAAHELGWVEKWPMLLKMPLDCDSDQ